MCSLRLSVWTEKISKGETFGDAQFGAAGAWVGRCFVRGSLDWLPREETKRRVVATDTRWNPWWTDAVRGLCTHELFHDAIFQRMEGDYGKAPARQKKINRLRKCSEQTSKLVVHSDTQSLEDACRRMNFFASGVRFCRSDDTSEFGGAGNALVTSLVDNTQSDAPGVPFLSQLTENGGKFRN